MGIDCMRPLDSDGLGTAGLACPPKRCIAHGVATEVCLSTYGEAEAEEQVAIFDSDLGATLRETFGRTHQVGGSGTLKHNRLTCNGVEVPD